MNRWVQFQSMTAKDVDELYQFYQVHVEWHTQYYEKIIWSVRKFNLLQSVIDVHVNKEIPAFYKMCNDRHEWYESDISCNIWIPFALWKPRKSIIDWDLATKNGFDYSYQQMISERLLGNGHTGITSLNDYIPYIYYFQSVEADKKNTSNPNGELLNLDYSVRTPSSQHDGSSFYPIFRTFEEASEWCLQSSGSHGPATHAAMDNDRVIKSAMTILSNMDVLIHLVDKHL